MTQRLQECPTPKELANFANGAVSPSRLSVIEEHLESCNDCSDLLAEGLPADTLVQRLSKIEFVEGQVGPRTSNDPFRLDDSSRYELIAELGEGGMGQVFKARHKVMKRMVALKTIRPALINHPEAVKRFAKEARAAARLSHPNIVTAYDAEQAGDLHLLVMEFVEGEPISQLVNCQGPLPVPQVIEYACQAAAGLQHAHERKMVHRDIKPQNLMLDRAGTIKILDFGLSKFRRDLESGECDSVADETILTLNNTSLGTEGFIAPEQAADARSVDIRSDIYSLGCTIFFMLTNRPPYFGAPPDDPDAIPDVTRFRSDLPEGLPAILERMMDPDPSQRYETPQQVIDALRSMDESAGSGPESAEPNSTPNSTPTRDVVNDTPNEEDSSGLAPTGRLVAIGIGVLILIAAILVILIW